MTDFQNFKGKAKRLDDIDLPRIGARSHVDLIVHKDKPRFDDAKHYLGRLCIRGHDYNGTGQSWRHRGHLNCVTCTRERARSWNKENPDRAKAGDKRRRLAHSGVKSRVRKRWPILQATKNSQSRAAKMSLPCNITSDYMRTLWREQSGRCYWTGIKLDFFVGGDRDARRPSIDRLIPTFGYTIGNVVWTSNFANRARGEMDANEFRGVLEMVAASIGKEDVLV